MFALLTRHWVNKQRKERDLPPLRRLPGGAMSDPGRCVIARALTADNDMSASIGDRISSIGSDDVKVPYYAMFYAACFDLGLHPIKAFRDTQRLKYKREPIKKVQTVVASEVMTWRERREQKRLIKEAELQIAEERRIERERKARERSYKKSLLEIEALQTGGFDYEDPPEKIVVPAPRKRLVTHETERIRVH